ncbi:MAG TPA: hypothetical protein VMK13_07920 [Streptosporangiaceae bacterium]|nr:hypothetical protein [Streptosporangiaceae bacterium]
MRPPAEHRLDRRQPGQAGNLQGALPLPEGSLIMVAPGSAEEAQTGAANLEYLTRDLGAEGASVQNFDHSATSN